MQVICSGRKTSRTSRLIDMCNESMKNGELSYIVCANHRQAQLIAQKARELGYNIPFPITYDEFIRRSYVGARIAKFYIDNADHLLQMMTPVRIEAIVVEQEEEE